MKITELIIEGFVLIMWIIAGMSAFIPLNGATLRLSWMMGAFFGLMFILMMTWISKNLLFFLCKISPSFKSHVEKHWGNPEYLKED